MEASSDVVQLRGDKLQSTNDQCIELSTHVNGPSSFSSNLCSIDTNVIDNGNEQLHEQSWYVLLAHNGS
jgi:hypothetical protein